MLTASLLATISVTLAFAMAVYNVFFVPSRADRKEMEKRLAKLELDDANHEARLTGFSLQMERENDRFEDRCSKMESQLNEVGQMRQDLAVVKTRLEGYSESLTDIKGTMKEIFNILNKR